MVGTQNTWGGVLLAAGILLAGCGGDDGKGGGSAKKAVESIPATPLTTDAPTRLTAPIFPQCGTEGFVRHGGVPVPATNKKLWQVSYQIPASPTKAPRPGQTTLVLIVESAPRGKAPSFGTSQVFQVAGRRVKIKRIPHRSQYGAYWRTGRAAYTMLADGTSRTVLDRFIGCLP